MSAREFETSASAVAENEAEGSNRTSSNVVSLPSIERSGVFVTSTRKYPQGYPQRNPQRDAIVQNLERMSTEWSYHVSDVQEIGEQVVVTGALTIDGMTREAIGVRDVTEAAAVQDAEKEAFCNAAVMFPITNLLVAASVVPPYTESKSKRTVDIAAQFPQEPIATRVGDMITARQLGIIRSLERTTGIDAEAECRNVLRCATDELSRSAAACFINYLTGLPGDLSASNLRRVV